MHYSTVDDVLWSTKLTLLNKQYFYRNTMQCQKLYQVFEVLSFSLDTGPQSFCQSFIALSMICCSKSIQKFGVPVCQVATVVMETTQLVLSQVENFFIINWELNKGSLSLPKIISKCCELVKLIVAVRLFVRHSVVHLDNKLAACLPVCIV